MPKSYDSGGGWKRADASADHQRAITASLAAGIETGRIERVLTERSDAERAEIAAAADRQRDRENRREARRERLRKARARE